jgi:hypothetical protein
MAKKTNSRSASRFWESIGPPDPGTGRAPRADQTRGDGGKKYQADRQNGNSTIGHNSSARQHPRVLPPLVSVRFALPRARWARLRNRCCRRDRLWGSGQREGS